MSILPYISHGSTEDLRIAQYRVNEKNFQICKSCIRFTEKQGIYIFTDPAVCQYINFLSTLYHRIYRCYITAAIDIRDSHSSLLYLRKQLMLDTENPRVPDHRFVIGIYHVQTHLREHEHNIVRREIPRS